MSKLHDIQKGFHRSKMSWIVNYCKFINSSLITSRKKQMQSNGVKIHGKKSSIELFSLYFSGTNLTSMMLMNLKRDLRTFSFTVFLRGSMPNNVNRIVSGPTKLAKLCTMKFATGIFCFIFYLLPSHLLITFLSDLL